MSRDNEFHWIQIGYSFCLFSKRWFSRYESWVELQNECDKRDITPSEVTEFNDKDNRFLKLVEAMELSRDEYGRFCEIKLQRLFTQILVNPATKVGERMSGTYYWQQVGTRFHLIYGSTTKIFKTMSDLERYCTEHEITPSKLH